MNQLFRYSLFIGATLLFCHYACQVGQGTDPLSQRLPDQVDFNFHIKPILSEHCFPCHGPDKNALKAELRLDLPEGGLRQHLTSGKFAFVDGRPAKSEAFQRMKSDDPEWKMPPPEFKRNISDFDLALVEKWIQQGAEYKKHWSFSPPQLPDLPRVENEDWCLDPIDFFILNKLEARNLSPNDQAAKEILLRRATLDLTGLPPTLEEIDDFISDSSPNAFENVIDRLLASPHYGERMAAFWLDLARYADSNGYSQDGLRIMWPWRDWVIKAFNDNLSYDQFLTWQLAGDMLPHATQEQRLATGFLRNYRQNAEGGIVDEEYRIEYAADRTETASTVFLGLTMQCAKCHDHKYDPVSQEEYYQLFSFFNNINERGITASDGNSGPELVLKSEEEKATLDSLSMAINSLLKKSEEIKLATAGKEISGPLRTLNNSLIADISFDLVRQDAFESKNNPADRFKISGDISQVEGVKDKALHFTAFDWVNIQKEEIKFGRADPFSFSFYFKFSDYDPYISILNQLGGKAENFPGYEIALYNGYPMLRMVHSLPAIGLQVQGTERLEPNRWIHITMTYDGSGEARGVSLFIDGEKADTKIVLDNLLQGIGNTKKVLTVGGRIPYNDSNKGFGFIDELKIYNRQITSLEARAIYTDNPIPDPRHDSEVHEYILANKQDYCDVMRQVQDLRRLKFSIEDSLTSVMIMEDMKTPRETFILDRGVYDAPVRPVSPGTPKAVFALAEDVEPDRAGLADWFLSEENPLTARVAVNRIWQLIFGQGLVKTSEDFGSQGALPSHPALLDWLAVTFRDSGWDMKAMIKRIMLSATYMQSSSVNSEKRALDPDNQLLARGPSNRLSAEEIRDCALASSGLLVKKIGGPSVKPYQPPGLWEEKGEFTKLKEYVRGNGEDLYRRSLYTFWRRTSPPPSMTTFDAPAREVCTPKRQPTNTPLQALVLLNDPQFVEAAVALAERVLVLPDLDEERRIETAYRLLTGLQASDEIVDLLLELLRQERDGYAAHPAKATDLLNTGEHKEDPSLEKTELAAMTVVCSTIMSFDETLVKR
ncbi:MAG: DUF1553 domain-containing protein [Saprospiraceae bacterium]|nr:DUF1553 domain-containing protein [Saprospiraceae bacterium]